MVCQPGISGHPNCSVFGASRKLGKKIMKTKQVASGLERAKELLEKVLDLAACQKELLEAGRLEDLEILLALREAPLAELAEIEESVEAEMLGIRNGHSSTAELEDLHELNLAILSLTDRIVDLDEQADRLAEQCG